MNWNYSVLDILTSFCENKASRAEVNHLIELSHSFAYTYLKYSYKNLGKVLLAEDVTHQELAIDAIAQLFERNEAGVFVKLVKAFSEWEPKIDSEETATFFLNRIVAKSTEKYVSGLLRQSDPFFSKILDSVNYIIEKQSYKKKQIFGTTYILQSDTVEKIGSLPDGQFIYDLPVQLFNDRNKMLSDLFNYIRDMADKTPAIPVNALIIKIKRIKSAGFILTDITQNGNETEVESILKKALEVTINKMEESYRSKNKINSDEDNKIKIALENIVNDIKDGGTNPGLHKYFLEQFKGLTFNEYKNRYQNIFEYLYKVLKKEIAKQLSD